jgi:hypothetical protein
MAKTKKVKKPYFSPYSKPFAPSKPQETVTSYEEIKRIDIDQYSSIPIPVVPLATHIGVDISQERCDDNSISSVHLVYTTYKVIPNPHYKKQLEQYEERYKKYKEELTEWNIQKKEYDKKEEERKQAAKIAMYNKLKKELEPT